MSKTLTGTVIKNSLAQTVTVQIEVVKKAPKYGKSLRLHKKFLAHLPKGVKAELGSRVIVVSSRPYSKTVHFVIREVLA